MDGLEWVQCEKCDKWNHLGHENDDWRDPDHYFCLKCRKEK